MMEDVVERLTRVETKVEENERRLIKQESNNDLLARLTLLSEQQSEFNKEYKQEMKEFRSTLDKVNTNLDGLNKNLQTLDMRVEKLESTDDSRKIDTVSLVKSILGYIATAVGGLVIGYLALKLGIK